MKKTHQILFGAIIIGVMALSVAYFFRIGQKSAPEGMLELKVGPATVYAEIADTPEKRSQGLSGRTELKPEHGMLFIFDQKARHSFWMSRMKFPLDFIWIRDHVIVDMTEHVAAPLTFQSEADLPRYAPEEDVDAVLEVSGGFVEHYGVKAGDRVKGY